ncbi:uncharacterized protein M421DRAFT_416142 [Didymella exigua CBS 183.55]|uniref:C2H2-type domain-containing protein n=1 Tax=Didymella exigua CBS 183.55 TaxID=1150837 RepID=A0A6A5S8F4_9PLEO|nr:uncharacterized protein M421DRAFT_416142 [Didymella exigua CBS 183.55]KAF1933787.1 hypothetical protein M421DRAFT_416142 [Didymella exigua CBS 183.55]
MHHCVLCDQRFASETALQQHRRDSPMHKKSLECKICNRMFGSEEALKQHRRDAPAHTGTFDCEACNRFFGSAGALKQHQSDSPTHRIPAQTPAVDDLKRSSSQASESPDPKTGHHPRGSGDFRRDSGVFPNKPTKKESSNRKVETQEFFTFPELHQSVAEAIAPHTTSLWFYETNHDSRYDRNHSTKVIGQFTCTKTSCRNRWGSKIVAVWIKRHARNHYSAVVYNQKCRTCGFLGHLKMDEECYTERVAYRLKKWAGVHMEQPPFEPKKGPPHEIELCEGCKRGVCPQIRDSEEH